MNLARRVRYWALLAVLGAGFSWNARAGEGDTPNASPSDKVAARFFGIAKEMASEMMAGMPEEQLRQGEREMKVEPGKLPEKMAEMLLSTYKARFAVSGEEAARMLEGKFDDAANTERIRGAIKLFADLKVSLPGPVAHTLKKFQAGELKGMNLEFAARYFLGVLDQGKKALDRTAEEKKPEEKR